MNALSDIGGGELKKMKTLRSLLIAAAVITFLLVTMGFIVRVNDASKACPDWPTCFGQMGMPDQINAQLQVAHRWLAGLSALFTMMSFVLVKTRLPKRVLLNRALAIALWAVLLQVFLGAGLVYFDKIPLLSTMHLLLAMTALGAVTAATNAIFFHFQVSVDSLQIGTFHPSFSRISLIVLIAIFGMMLSGSVVAASGLSVACADWPLCMIRNGISGLGWAQIVHQINTIVVGLLMSLVFLKAWREERQRRTVLTAATAAFIIMIGQMILGIVKVNKGFPSDLVVLHGASAAALLAAQMIVFISSKLEHSDASFRPEAPVSLKGQSQRFKDFILLNKPIIVLLLLVTTYAGMVVGGKQIPGLALTFWTLLSGALAAGGSSAINQYIDRDLDKAMQRTAKRPLPSGRLTAAEGLAYGVGASILSFFLMASFVNLLAALLLLAGIIYYVLLYSIWLKRLTVQNIVIGGGAGAIPPLVGWAAASGSLNIPSLFLFAIVFLWTPPHFWALALVRKNDYARAGVPMLPVVRGESETRTQIFIYTLELVGLTLLMPIFKISGSIFLVSAVVLGLWLISTAWRVLKNGGNKTAWKMYRYSSMYLAFLFLALVLDVLL